MCSVAVRNRKLSWANVKNRRPSRGTGLWFEILAGNRARVRPFSRNLELNQPEFRAEFRPDVSQINRNPFSNDDRSPSFSCENTGKFGFGPIVQGKEGRNPPTVSLNGLSGEFMAAIQSLRQSSSKRSPPC